MHGFYSRLLEATGGGDGDWCYRAVVIIRRHRPKALNDLHAYAAGPSETQLAASIVQNKRAYA